MDELARYFDILEVRRGASPEELKRAYRDMAQVWHPDRYNHNPRLRAKAEEKLKNINEAYQRLSAYSQQTSTAPPPQRASPPPSSQSQHTEARETKPPPPGPTPPPPKPPSEPQPTSKAATEPPPAAQPSNTNAGCIVGIVIFVALLIIIGASQHSTEPQSYHVQPSYQPPPSQPPPPPTPDPEIERLTELKTNQPPPPHPPAPPTPDSEIKRLTELKTKIEERIARKDAEFDRLERWYQRGIFPLEEPAYRESLAKAQNEEQDIAALILTYNARKKQLDTNNNAK